MKKKVNPSLLSTDENRRSNKSSRKKPFFFAIKVLTGDSESESVWVCVAMSSVIQSHNIVFEQYVFAMQFNGLPWRKFSIGDFIDALTLSWISIGPFQWCAQMRLIGHNSLEFGCEFGCEKLFQNWTDARFSRFFSEYLRPIIFKAFGHTVFFLHRTPLENEHENLSS